MKNGSERLQVRTSNLFEEMDDDFNTANAISVLFELSKHANYYLMEKNTSQEVIEAFIDAIRRIILSS